MLIRVFSLPFFFKFCFSILVVLIIQFHILFILFFTWSHDQIVNFEG